MIYKVVTTVIDQAREASLMCQETHIQLFADYTIRDYVYARLYPLTSKCDVS